MWWQRTNRSLVGVSASAPIPGRLFLRGSGSAYAELNPSRRAVSRITRYGPRRRSQGWSWMAPPPFSCICTLHYYDGRNLLKPPVSGLF